jgi:hypothetical protein
MTVFREHRGSLADSMKTMVDLPDCETAIRHIRKHSFIPNTFLICMPYTGPDWRIDWPRTYIVINEYGPIGFADGPLFGGDPEEATVVHTHIDEDDTSRSFLDSLCESMTATSAAERAVFTYLSGAIDKMTDEQRATIRRLNGLA